MKESQAARGLPVLGLLLVALAIAFVAGAFGGSRYSVRTIAQGALDFEELSERFATVAKEDGALAAYKLLREARLPSGTDIHLLGHIIGDELYAQEGIDGIRECTDEFRNACSHAIVIGTLTEQGEEGLAEIRNACREAPGGSGAYTMCFHGLGHGVFAAQGYDLQRTVAFCKKTGTPEYRDREYEECFGGAVMELMGGGGHDREAWLLARERYLLNDDPLSPCSGTLVPEELKGICYVYLSPRLFEFAGANMAHPEPRDFQKAFTYCDRIEALQPRLRNVCFGGIGKEFPVLVLGRDIRAIESASREALATLWSWCALAPHEEGKDACAEHALNSLFWGGENDLRISLSLCEVAPHERNAERCFSQLRGLIGYYLSGAAHSRACRMLPESYRDACVSAPQGT